MAATHIENGFPVRYISDADGTRWLTVDPTDADMTGWRVEVVGDERWYRESGLEFPEYEREVRVESFGLDALWGIGQRWCVLVDWGENVRAWVAP